MQWDNEREELKELHLREGISADSAQQSFALTSFGEAEKREPTLISTVSRLADERRVMVWAVSGSVLLHAGLLVALLSFRLADRAVATLEEESDSLLESVAIRFVAHNPLRSQPNEPVVRDDSESLTQQSRQQLAEDAGTISPEDGEAAELVAQEDLLEPDSDSEAQSSERVPEDGASTTQSTSEILVVENTESAPSRLLPSVSAMRSSIQQVNEQRRRRDWMRQCNPLQEDAHLLDCGEAESPDYSAATSNATYLALNPTFTATREQRSISTIALQRDTLIAQLEEADVPQWLKDYAQQEIDISISDESRFGNPMVDQIYQMTEKGEAAARARAMFGDAWLLDTMRREIQQNVHRENTLKSN